MKYILTKTLLCLAMSCTAGINCHNIGIESKATTKEEVVYKHHEHNDNYYDNGYHEYYHHENSHHSNNHH